MNPASQQPRPPVINPSQQQFKIKARKREAVQKYEPEVFRDNLFALIKSVDSNDNEKYITTLEANEAKLDLKRYAEPFFELFIVGGLIGAGGTVNIKEHFPFAIFETPAEGVKARVDILSNMARRLKYFPKKLEETVSHMLTYINKFGDNLGKLARACGLFASSGLISLGVLTAVFKDHLVNDGTSLSFLCSVLQSYLTEQKVEHLTLSLKKAEMDWRLIEFFPPQNRSTAELIKRFKAEKLSGLSDYFIKQQNLAVKEQTAHAIKDMISASKTSKEVVDYLQKQVKENSWTDVEVPTLLWNAIIESVDWGSRMDQLEGILVKILATWIPTIAVFSQSSAKSQLALLLHIQSYCYDDSRFLKHFRLIVQLLYKHDAVSESAVMYWYSKGASPHGKKVMVAQLEPFIAWLNEQEEESDEDDE